MKIKEALSGLGGLLLIGAVFLVLIGLSALWIYGTVWASNKLLPWFFVLTWLGLLIVVFVFLPLSIPRATRGFSSIALLITSYVFGATLWMEGLLLTLQIWGGFAVFVGLAMGGIGVVPIAMLATLVNGMWGNLIQLVLLTVMTFSSRAGALSLAQSLEK